MKTRYYIIETYCYGQLSTSYSVSTEKEALAILQETKKFDEPNAFIKIEKQTRKWYQRRWKTVEVVGAWWN